MQDTAEIAGAADLRPELSSIVTSFQEEMSLREFHQRLDKALQASGRSYEILMIDDGSSDRTFELMKELFAENPRIRCIQRFSKNYGQLAAMTAGICAARGDAVLFIDSDLQLAPEELPRLLGPYDEGDDLVSGYRRDRKDSVGRMIPSKLANILMRKASDSTLRDFGCTFKLYRAEILRAFDFGPRRLFDTPTVVSMIGRYSEVPVSHFPRPYGRSGWTLRKLWSFMSQSIVNLSERPFQILAALCSVSALLVLLRIAVEVIFPFSILPSVSNGLLLNTLLLASLLIIAVLCVVGEFTIRSYLRLFGKPGYIVVERVSRPAEPRSLPYRG